jgi:hypothetical protein
MKYAIIGSGAIGTALATQFARKGIDVAVANSRGPESLAEFAKHVGRSIDPTTIEQTAKADIAILAVPFGAVPGVAKAFGRSRPRIVVDATNAIDFPSFRPSDLGGRDSSSVVGDALKGSIVVKAFNTLPAAVLQAAPEDAGMRRVVFLSGDDEGASEEISALVEKLGFFPIYLGKLAEGGRLQQFGGPLTVHNLMRKE